LVDVTLNMVMSPPFSIDRPDSPYRARMRRP
jgi:hypothetical protein